MSLSKPLVNVLSIYLEQLYMHPLRTKSITSAVLASCANYVSQKIMGCKEINQRSIFAYAMFGLLFGGSVPHYANKLGERYLVGRIRINPYLLIFMIERLIFTPIFQVLSLYFLSVFEGKSQREALHNLIRMYWPLLKANWAYRSLAVFINIRYVSSNHRVVTGNLMSFFWAIFISIKRRRLQNRLDMDKKSTASSGITRKDL